MSTKNEPSTSEHWESHAAYDALLLDLARSLNGPLAVVDVNTGFQLLGNPISLFASDELPAAKSCRTCSRRRSSTSR